MGLDINIQVMGNFQWTKKLSNRELTCEDVMWSLDEVWASIQIDPDVVVHREVWNEIQAEDLKSHGYTNLKTTAHEE